MINGLVLSVFFCTGAVALVYEVLWTRYLTLMFGSTIQAQTVVLAVFMGGLALGNRVVGKWADRQANPLLAYGYFEAAAGLYAFCFPYLYSIADRVFIQVGSGMLEQSWALLALKGGLSLALLLGPTCLMGGTLPLLSAWLARNSNDAGRWSARFYSTNSLGAVAGAWLAGFVLIRELGLEASLQSVAFANVLAGFAVAGMARKYAAEKAPEAPSADRLASDAVAAKTLDIRLACFAVALTGGVSMGLEVLSSRSLAMIVGGSLQAFAIVLMAFILGIGAGSAAIASPRVHRWQAGKSTVFFLLLSACWVGSLVLAIEQGIDCYRIARLGLARNETGYFYHQVLTGLMALILLGVPAALNGAVLPLFIRDLAGRSSDMGNQVGRLLTWNTMGAVVGVLLTGFVLMPVAGVRNAFGILAGLLCAGALVFAVRNKMRLSFVVCLLASAGLAAGFALGGQGWRYVLSSSIFRIRETRFTPDLMAQIKKNVGIRYYKDAADATVSVEETSGALNVKVNGKPDASSHMDLSTQMLLGHIPMIACPNAKEVFILGLGSGITAGAVLKHPIDRLTIAENCRPMLEAARFFDPYNDGAITNSRTRIVREDARTVLKLSPQSYDVIISEPSNPWTAGIGGVFSRQFFDLAASRLKEGGVMGQWFHVYEMRDEIVSLVLRTFGEVFPSMEIWDTLDGDILLLGSKRPWRSDLASMRVLFDREAARADMNRIGIDRPELLWARQLASQQTAFAIAGDGPTQTDLFPVLDWAAPEAFYVGVNSKVLEEFDERTFQFRLAPQEKTQCLSVLSTADLKSLFGRFNTVNAALRQYWPLRVRLKTQGYDSDFGHDPNGLPIVFRSKESKPGQTAYPDKASEMQKTLLNARAMLATDPSRWKEQVEIICANLKPYRTDTPSPGDWTPELFAASAAQMCLVQNDLALAEKVLKLGLEISPNSNELGYLARILERKQAAGRQ